MNQTFKTGIILGICIAVAVGSAWFTIKTISTVSADHAVLSQIVQLINANNKQAAPAQTQAPAAK